MKFFIKTLAITLLIMSCNTEVKRDSYVIDGNAKGIYNGIRVYLKALDQNNRQIDIDTAIVMNEKFTFEGKVIGPEMRFLYINSVKGYLPIIIENSEITVDVDKDDAFNSKIYGSKINESLIAYNTKMSSLNDRRREINLELRSASQAGESEKVATLNKELAGISDEMRNSPLNFIKNNSDNFYSLVLLESMLRTKNIRLQEVIDAYDSLDENLKSSMKGKEIMTKVEEAKKILEAQANTEIGKIAPDFSAPTPDGKVLGLKDVKGKVTLIDFWAAWCGPCRRENPNLVDAYSKYHDKGLEIIGVSLDGRMGQSEPKAAWIKAIEDDNLIWNQVSNLKYFDGPIAQMYNIQSIPASLILDADGRIVAKNLRGPALQQKLAELLD